MKKIVVYFIIATVISGCQSAPKTVEELGPYPDDYQSLVDDYISKHYYDPYSIRNASVSVPAPGKIGWKYGWFLCIESNAKNRMGAYTGIKRTGMLIQDGEIVSAYSNFKGCYDDRLDYNPLSGNNSSET